MFMSIGRRQSGVRADDFVAASGEHINHAWHINLAGLSIVIFAIALSP
jgi:hypothetical protein